MLHCRYCNVLWALYLYQNITSFTQTHIIESGEAQSVLEGRLQVSVGELKQVRTGSC